MEVWEQILTYILNNYPTYLVVVLAVIMSTIFGILTLLKKPIKKLTSKIQDEKCRKLANKSIIILSFLLSVGIWALLSYIWPMYFKFNIAEILLTGAFPIVAYAFIDGVITKDKAKNLTEAVIDFVEEEKQQEEQPIDEKKETAENKLDELIKSLKG